MAGNNILMLRSRRRTSSRNAFAEPPVSNRPCAFPGCVEAGDYRAPHSPTQLDEYRWFCLTHVREYNANWDYFSGMSSIQIEDFMKDAMLGHRPTWKVHQQKLHLEAQLEEALHEMRHGARQEFREQRRKRAQMRAALSEEQRSALAVLNLEGEATLQEIKKQYKLLVKKHHPDVNRENKQAEEHFKRITEAYQFLVKQYRHTAE